MKLREDGGWAAKWVHYGGDCAPYYFPAATCGHEGRQGQPPCVQGVGTISQHVAERWSSWAQTLAVWGTLSSRQHTNLGPSALE